MIDWIETNIPPWAYLAIIVHVVILGTVAYMILLERKVASWVQDRIGPNRVGLGFGIIPGLKNFHFWGLGQPLADGLKFVLKEDYRAKGVDVVLFTLAPAIMIGVVIISIAVIPWGGWKQTTKRVIVGTEVVAGDVTPQMIDDRALTVVPSGAQVVARTESVAENEEGERVVVADVTYRYPFQIANLNIGVLYILAVLSLAVYGVVIGGWASNNKYSFLGGLRATANMISYEIPLGLAVLTIVVMFGSLDLGVIVERQVGYWWGIIPAWNVFTQPLAFLMFLICIHAEANRAPFDMAEAEQELVGGYHTEYSSMRFALFFLAEYAGMITTSAVCVALFFGGWHLPGLGDDLVAGSPSVTDSLILCIVRAFVFFAKTMLIIFVFMWVRWSLPRFRFDQVMSLAWRGLIPIALAQLMITAIVIYLIPPGQLGIFSGRTALALLVANVGLLVGAMLVSTILPAGPDTNRKIAIANSRFRRTPLPGMPVGVSGLNREAAERLPVDLPMESARMGP